MASVFKRQKWNYDEAGERTTKKGPPVWVAKYDAGAGADGKTIWKMKVVDDEHQSSRHNAQRWADQYEHDEKEKREGAPAPAAQLCGDLMEKWIETLTNRSKVDDKSRYQLHVRPVFAAVPVDRVDVGMLMKWVDAQRAGEKPAPAAELGAPSKKRKPGRPASARLSDGTIRHNLNLVSRFFSWAVMRGHVATNPVRSIPTNARPHQAAKKDVPYIRDDATVRKIFNALPTPIDLMFYIGHTSGLRIGEICGLRLSDFDFLDEGVIRARFSYDGFLKEDKRCKGLSKRAPAAADLENLIRPWLNEREAEGAQPEDYVFNNPRGGHYKLVHLDRVWNETLVAAKLVKPAPAPKPGEKAPEPEPLLTLYEATRHSFASRLLEAGNSMDEVSAALNHSSVAVTERSYSHFKRTTYSPTMRMKISGGKLGKTARVVPMKKKAASG